MSIFKRFQKPVVVDPAEDDAQACPRDSHRCFQCGGYEECDETFMNRFFYLSAIGELPHAHYPGLPCPTCQEVH